MLHIWELRSRNNCLLTDLENELEQQWNLSFKVDSKTVIVCEGGDSDDIDECWALTDRFSCLGHILQPSGSVRACFYATKRACWNAFFHHLSSKKSRRVPIQHKLKLLQRVILPIVAYRCTRWPYQKTYAKELDALQTKMIAVLTPEVRWPDEELGMYIKRRNQMASRLAGGLGRWSRVWAKRVINWHDHLCRARNAKSLTSRIFLWHGAAWLREQRLLHGTSSIGGRTRTRLPVSAFVERRWEESVTDAEEAYPELVA